MNTLMSVLQFSVEQSEETDEQTNKKKVHDKYYQFIMFAMPITDIKCFRFVIDITLYCVSHTHIVWINIPSIFFLSEIHLMNDSLCAANEFCQLNWSASKFK